MLAFFLPSLDSFLYWRVFSVSPSSRVSMCSPFIEERLDISISISIEKLKRVGKEQLRAREGRQGGSLVLNWNSIWRFVAIYQSPKPEQQTTGTEATSELKATPLGKVLACQVVRYQQLELHGYVCRRNELTTFVCVVQSGYLIVDSILKTSSINLCGKLGEWSNCGLTGSFFYFRKCSKATWLLFQTLSPRTNWSAIEHSSRSRPLRPD